jgi:NhaP-type Na+/H+ or K+/H+ antiporter
MAICLGQMLSADSGTARDLVLTMTYVVVFSIGTQGLTIGPLVRRWELGSKPAQTAHTSRA